MILLTALITYGDVVSSRSSVPLKAVERSIQSGLKFLRGAQNEDGSFGNRQRHLQTGLAILAFLSSGATPGSDPESPIPAAAEWLLKNSGEDGFLGDGEYAMESHAVAALALAALIGQVDDDLDRRISSRSDEALRYSLKIQDKAVGAEYYGGWKAKPKSKANDRRVTSWYLLYLKSMEIRGRRISRNSPKRALAFLEGSQKVPGHGKQFDKADTGGFSYDAAGLPVVTITGGGLACMSLYQRSEKNRDLALDWLTRHRPLWYGPNFYCTYFFTARAYAWEKRRGEKQTEQSRLFISRMWELLREHQNPDGSFQIPPGNAENTKVMGKTYATAMALLILNADRGMLPIDAR